MTSALALALFSQAAIAAAGLGVMQLLQRHRRIGLLTSLPFAWGIGVAALYVLGAIVVRVDGLVGSWHYVVLAAFLLISAWGWRVRIGQAPNVPKPSVQGGLRWYDWALLGLILAKGWTALHGAMVNPVIDSDAANIDRWVGLAKEMGEFGGLAEGVEHRDRFFPSLLPTWTRMFLPRWHDSLVSLPWFFTFASFVGAAFAGCYRLTQNRSASLVVAYLFSAIPLAAVHVVRPGYSDLIAAYFFLCSIAFWQASLRHSTLRNGDTGLFLIASLACAMTKQEGAIWALWVLGVAFSFYLRRRRALSWHRIWVSEAAVLLVLYLGYLASAEFIRTNVEMDVRLGWLFEIDFEWAAVRAFATAAFLGGSFNLWWWLCFILVGFVAVRSESDESRAMALYAAALFLAVFYFACFTGNARLTVAGTNLGRFLLQITPLLFPLSVVFAQEFAARRETCVSPPSQSGPTRSGSSPASE